MHWSTWAGAALAFLLYYNTLDAGFVYDDRRAILTNPDVTGHNAVKSLFDNDFWGTPLSDKGSHGSYRPLCVATYRLNYAFAGPRAWSYHLVNMVFHCCATVLVGVTARRMLPRSCARVGSAVATLTFAAHPIHTEAVAAIVGRADLAACNLFLLSFLTYCEHLNLRDKSKSTPICHQINSTSHRIITNGDQNFRLSCHGLMQQILSNFRRLLKSGRYGPSQLIKGHNFPYNGKNEKNRNFSECCVNVSENSELLQWITLGGTLLLAAAATLCKEPAIMVLPLCAIYDLLRAAPRRQHTDKKRWRSLSALSAGAVAVLYWRLQVAGAPPTFAAADNPAARDPSTLTRFLTIAYLPVFNFYLLLYPFHLSFDWSMDAIPRITTLLDPRNILTIFFYTLLSRVTWKTICKELKMHSELVERTNQKLSYRTKYGYYKAKYKSSYYNHSRQQYRGSADVDRRGYHIPHRETGMKKLCVCSSCKHPVAEEHTGACRSINNNNYMNYQGHCSCTQLDMKSKRRKSNSTQTCPRVALVMFISFMSLPFVPASNVIFYVGFVVAERVLYMPSVGFCLLLGLGAGLVTRGWQRHEWRCSVFICGLLIVLVAMCSRTMRRNLDWRDEESLFRSALYINPPRAYGNLGSVLSSQGRAAEAEAAFQKALLYRPNMADVHYNLGILLQNQGRYHEAIISFERAIYFRPSMALAYVNLGTSLAADGRLSEAASVLRAGARAGGTRVRDRREHDAARVSALVQLAALHIQRSHWHKALSAYKEALEIIPESGPALVGWSRHSVLTMASDMYTKLHHWSHAEKSSLQALEAAPYDAGTHLAYAKLLSKNSSRSLEAEEWYKKALSLAPSDPNIRDQFGQYLRSHHRVREAAQQLVASAQLVPTDAERAAAAAKALRDARRCRSAEKWYAKAAQLNPKDARSHSNLGAILHLNGKYSAAAASYRTALELQPGDDITLTNLKRVTALMNHHNGVS